jgi:hypothetical protein
VVRSFIRIVSQILIHFVNFFLFRYQTANTAAVIRLSPRRFGIVYSTTIDSKKRKHGLVVSIFNPGPKPIPWLPNFHHLAPVAEIAEFGVTKDSPMSPDAAEAGEIDLAEEDADACEEDDDEDFGEDDLENEVEEEEEAAELQLALAISKPKPSYATVSCV